MGFGILTPQSAMFYEGKTDSCRKSPFLEELEKSMIS
jgi:hypothetical protein